MAKPDETAPAAPAAPAQQPAAVVVKPALPEQAAAVAAQPDGQHQVIVVGFAPGLTIPVTQDPPVTVMDPLEWWASKSGGQRAFNAVVDEQVVDWNGGLVALVENPDDSGENAHFYELALSTNVPGQLRRWQRPQYQVHGQAAPTTNLGMGERVSPLRMYRGDDVEMRGSVGPGRSWRVEPPGREFRFHLASILRPGYATAYTFNPAGGEESPLVSIDLVWVDRPRDET